MAQPQAREGDQGQGVCYGHSSPTPFTTTFTSQGCAVSTVSNGKATAVIGTKGVTTCGHTTTATTGSSTVTKEGKACHRVGDTGICDAGGYYTVISGSPNILVG